MRAAIDDAAALHHQDLVAIADRAEAVGDDDAGAAGAADAVHDMLLGLGVHRAGRLIQNQHARLHGQGTRDRQTLTFAAAEIGAAAGQFGAVTIRTRGDEVVRGGALSSLYHLFLRQSAVPQRDVVANRAAEQADILIDIGDGPAQRGVRPRGEFPPAKPHLSGDGPSQADHQSAQGGLAGTGGTNQRDTAHLARPAATGP